MQQSTLLNEITEVMVNCNQATWSVVKCSQSKYRKNGIWKVKKQGREEGLHKNSLMTQLLILQNTFSQSFWLTLVAIKKLS